MGKEVAFKNRDRFIQIGIAIAALRRIRGMSQEELSAKAGISRSLLSLIEAPNAAHGFSLEVLFDLADALDVEAVDLINASMFPDSILNKKSK
ncbi:MAG: helix-turn-helix domain-containing protein [Bacteroides sp.]|nr:helix-turn-helix domain-containing protein [Eubacterium sp.]MCM1418415.1 helix-turn-helix domain-containing protein [Roseburia sp.]MCM1461563.1 helix-turn-helix domain-containing protein [Bacteroides sp.]